MIEGDILPAMTLVTTTGPVATRGAPLVLYTYPRDDTPGCTTEASDFTALLPSFADLGVRVVGISRDPLERHARFAAKHGLAVPLATDDGSLSAQLGTWVEKTLYGRTSMGMERATFLFDADGRLRRLWRKVRVKGHAKAVLDAARTLVSSTHRA